MKRKLFAVSQAMATAALLAACGGGSHDDPPAAPPPPPPPPSAAEVVPASASASVQGMVSYLQTLSTVKPDDKEAADVSTFMPPVSDDTEPSAV
jgi:hypothetical protein